MRILQVVESMDLHPGLFSTTLPGFISTLRRSDIACDVVSGAMHDTHAPNDCAAENIVSVDEDQPTEAMNLIAPIVAEAQVIHIHCPSATIGVIAAAAAKSQGKPFIVSTHGTLTAHLRGRGKVSLWFENRRYAKNFRQAARVTCLTPGERELLRERGLRFDAIPMPIGCDFSHEAPLGENANDTSKLPLNDGKRILAYLGDIDSQLGLVPFFKACDELEDDLDSWRVIIAGRPIDDGIDFFQAAARRHGKEHLGEYVVFPNYDQQRSILNAAEIVVQPSPTPVLPVAPLWAMWHGKATLVSSALGLQGLENENAGAVVEPTRKGFLHSLRNMVTSSPDDLKLMGEKGAAFVRDSYSWGAIAPKYVEMYRQVVAN